MNSQVQTVKTSINNLTDVSQNSQLTKSVADIQNELKEVSKTLYSTGVNPTPTSSLSPETLSNLMGPNWIIGNQTMNNLSQQYAYKDGKVMQICPYEKPYFFENKCQNCNNGTNLFFNILLSKCVPCKNYNLTLHQCLDTFGSNLETASDRMIVAEGKNISDYETDVYCPTDKPFYQNG